MKAFLLLAILTQISVVFAKNKQSGVTLTREPAGIIEIPEAAYVDEQKQIYAVETQDITLYDCDGLFVVPANPKTSSQCVVVMSGNYVGSALKMKPVVVFGSKEILDPVLDGKWSAGLKFRFEVKKHDLSHVFKKYPKSAQKSVEAAINVYNDLGGSVINAKEVK